MKAKIGLVVPSIARGGGVPSVARFVKDVVLRDGRFELRVVSLCMESWDADSLRFLAPSSWTRGARASKGVWQGLEFTHVGCYGAELEFQRFLPRAAVGDALRDCDLIQLVCGSPAWANVVLGLGKPVSLQVATRAKVERRVRDAALTGPLGWWRRAMSFVTDRLDDRGLRGVDAVQVENPWMLEYARRVCRPDADVRYAPPGIDADAFVPLAERTLTGPGYILCVGRLADPRKNVGLLLEAYALLPAAFRADIELVLAGSSSPGGTFWKRAEALGVRDRVRYVARPSLEELAELYRRARVFALTSDEEGLGVVILEAMASGVPVVSTRSGGPDGILTEGRDGHLVPLDDVHLLADRLAALIESPSDNLRMGLEARRTVESRYAEEVAGLEFVKAWEGLLGLEPGRETSGRA